MKKKYIIITPAHNEEAYIEKTIQSVLSQKIKPLKWVIISDRSTDGTDDIINSYQKKNKFIEFVRISGDNSRNFGAKVNAINNGLEKIKDEKCDFIGILDADLEFQSDYFEKIFINFDKNKKLGIGGGNYLQMVDGQVQKRLKGKKSVAGGAQMFRKECFDQVGGFLPLKYGSEDAAAEITARMHGWEVETFFDIDIIHHGLVGGKGGKVLKGRYIRGKSFYQIGYHPMFMILRSFIRLLENPKIIGSFAEIFGYFAAFIRFHKPAVSKEVVKFLRKEQKKDMKTFLLKIFRPGKAKRHFS